MRSPPFREPRQLTAVLWWVHQPYRPHVTAGLSSLTVSVAHHRAMKRTVGVAYGDAGRCPCAHFEKNAGPDLGAGA
jgi:hypothetical protein